MVFNATFNNISVISWWSVLLVEETGVPHPEKKNDLYKSLRNYHIFLYWVYLPEWDWNSQIFWNPVLNLVLFNLIYSSYLKFRSVEISGISK
jgi:hypothetical protein